MTSNFHPLSTDLDLVVAQVGELWSDLRGGTLFLTGGTGFFGCWLLESFLWANRHLSLNAKIIALTRRPESFCERYPHLANDSNIVLHRGDVRSFEFPAGEASFVIHAAGDLPPANTASCRDVFDTAIDGARRTLEFAAQRRVRRYLYVSSGAVYGSQPPHIGRLSEDYLGAPDISNPYSSYGEGKRGGELLTNIYYRGSGLCTTIARCFTFIGPYMPLNQSFAAGNFVHDLLENKNIAVTGDGTPVRSYMYAADLTIWLWTILFKGTAGSVYNVGSPDEVTVGDLASEIAACGTPLLQVHKKSAPVTAVPPQRYVPNVERAQRELGLSYHTDLSAAIRKTVAWFKR